MNEKIVIYGAGDIGTMLADDIIAKRRLEWYEFKGFVDDKLSGYIEGYKILGTVGDLKEIFNSGIENIVVTLMKSPDERLNVIRKIKEIGFKFPKIYDKNKISYKVNLGEGVIIEDSSTFLGHNQNIGEHVVIGPQTVIEGRVSVGSGSILRAFSFIGYNSWIGEACDVGIRSSLIPGVKIEGHNVIGPHVLQRKNLPYDSKNLRYS